ncbi:PREDICTED: uncharacterized protein LOC106786945 [Polistes canadensis]|uniref:uncharacterized protein LOC106786945 n=1 Tax=Polistes canadensis TaxID=91411 RepID=UPI000718C790|nr:PREDICTED: uncharacterized protein LOC106786945 [Polistes canadensis]
MAEIPSTTLANGYKMPMLALGTYLSQPGEVEKAVIDAIDLGYRHIDTAFFYENEKEIGAAIEAKIQDKTVTREELFITTKLWNNRHKEESVVATCKQSLENLGLTYIDLYLIHWPFAYQEGDVLIPKDKDGKLLLSDTDYLETWRGMEECVQQGLTRSIGVSNFNSEQIARLVKSAKFIPVNNQIEVSVNLNQENLINFCKKYNIVVSGYSPLGRPGNRLGIKNSLDDPVILKIAEKYKKTPAQIALRYVYQQGAAVIPKSVTKSRIKENMEIFDFELTTDEMTAIKAIGTGERIAPSAEVQDHKYKRKMVLNIPNVKFYNGNTVPQFGLGTWKSKPGEVTQAVKDAIDAGYRHIDCAHVYRNEKEVGEAIKVKIDEGVVTRQDLFITSKLWNTYHKTDLVEPALKTTLSNLGLEYLDLYLIHWPFAFKEGDELFPTKSDGIPELSDVDYVDTWKGMEGVLKKGLTKNIGVSNFNSEQITRLLNNCTVKPVTNQIECHPYLTQRKLSDFCKEKEIVITAYSPLGSPDRPWAKPDDPKLLDDVKLNELAKKYNKTTAQILLRYQLDRGHVVIPKSVTKSRIIENTNIFDFKLTSEDIAYIDTFDCNGRICSMTGSEASPNYPFNIPF